MPEIRFDLRARGRTAPVRVTVSAEPIRPVELLPVLNQVNDALIGLAVQDSRVSCGAGCGACCRQMVPIGEMEARYLAELIAAMPEERRKRVTQRFVEAVAKLRANDLLAVPSDPGERHRRGMEYFNLGLPCPFLDDERCSIYEHRPASCREYLVTSPAANCSAPTAENIQMVELPAKLSQVLYRFGDGRGEETSKWMPLPLLLEWAAEHRDNAQPTVPGPELLRTFMNKLTKRGT